MATHLFENIVPAHRLSPGMLALAKDVAKQKADH